MAPNSSIRSCQIAIPIGQSFGWGVCGRQIVKSIARRLTIRLLASDCRPRAIESDLERAFIKLRKRSTSDKTLPLLQAIYDHHLEPYEGVFAASRRVGYTFFESDVSAEAVNRAKQYFQRVATGSSQCTDVLRDRGLGDATTVIQGIDPLTFHPGFTEKEYLHDRFILFSGGKLELRKGHDLVVRAYKALQDRHDDVMLVCSWHNMWEHSLATIGASPHVKFQLRRGDAVANTKAFLADNGIDLERVCVLPLHPNEVMARIYQNTDIGLFPNRCEGGTNLVLMEYMACGKPVIAGYSAGHRDIVNEQNSLLLHPARKIKVSLDARSNAEWDDYNVDDVVDRLEWAYQHRDQLRPLAKCHSAR